MAWLKFYEEENKRQPVLHAARLSQHEARKAVDRLRRHFLGRESRPIAVSFTSGNRRSHADCSSSVTLNVRDLNWLLVAHEFAHCWDFTRRRWKCRHDKKLAKLVDRVCAYILKQGWHEHALAHDLALREDGRRATEERNAAPPSVDDRLAVKYEQLARLESKRKRLDTLISKKKRSISAIERAAARKSSKDQESISI